MVRRIAILQGHPDKAGHHLCHALADAYARGAAEAGHQIDRIEIAGLDFPWLRTMEEFNNGAVPASLQAAQAAIAGADHLLIVYPLWLGGMPAILKAFFEQVIRPDFAFTAGGKFGTKIPRLRGKSARIVITMGMPALVYRWYFGAHSLRSLERNILHFCGIGPIRESLFGMVEAISAAKRDRWLETMRKLGMRAG
jgi:putative NADPH-quinone reductase